MSVSTVLSYTQDMMLVVLEQQWEDLLDMQLKQDEMLKALFSSKDPNFTAQEKDDLFEVQRLNQEILTAAESHKTEIASKLRDMRQGKTKASAYQAL